MAATVTASVTKTETGSTLSWTISFTGSDTSKSYTIHGPNGYVTSALNANSTSSRTETGAAGDVHTWHIHAESYVPSLGEMSVVDRYLSAQVLGSGVYVYTSGVWKPLNF